MYKLFILMIFLFLPLLIFTQSNLIIDSTSIPVRVKNEKISFKKRKKVSVKIPLKSSLIDTIIHGDPESMGEHWELIAKNTGYSPMRVKSTQLILKRTDFLNNPLIYLSHNEVKYAPYKCIYYYFKDDKFYGLGYNDVTNRVSYNDSLHSYTSELIIRYNSETLLNFKNYFGAQIPNDVSEIYITGMAFISIPAKAKLTLPATFKVILKD